jgi:acetyltransferase-like isoleucine patch superfamily enzyme
LSGFRQLASDLKVMLYRRHGAVIGDDVAFEPGAAIFADAIEVGAGCQFGADTVIVAEALKLGTGCLFGRSNDIICRCIEIDDMLFLANRVVIGQGGAFNPEAELVIGHSCLVSSDCLINTTHRVSIGDRSCLSPKVSIYTHSHWQNVLEGYQASLLPVTIGNDVWITGGCLIAPGAVMEDGSQALANSAVSGVVPSRTIVWGVPARPVGKVRGDLSIAEREAIMRRIWPKIEDALRQAGFDPALAGYTGSAPDGGLKAPVQVAFGSRPASYDGTFFDLATYQVTGPTTPVADVVRNVLRKHGIRFEPHFWRYRADVGRFNA